MPIGFSPPCDLPLWPRGGGGSGPCTALADPPPPPTLEKWSTRGGGGGLGGEIYRRGPKFEAGFRYHTLFYALRRTHQWPLQTHLLGCVRSEGTLMQRFSTQSDVLVLYWRRWCVVPSATHRTVVSGQGRGGR